MRRKLTAGLIVGVAMLLTVAVIPAQGANVHALQLTTSLPENRSPISVAINQSTHQIYVGSLGENRPGRVYIFGEDGELDAEHPTLTGASTETPRALAVDNS